MTERQDKNLEDVIQKLESKEQVESIEYIVENLPEYVESLKVIEEKVAFAVEMLQDSETLEFMTNNVENKVRELRIGDEHFEALIDLTHMLPKLVPLLHTLDDLKDFALSVWSDEETVEDAIRHGKHTLNKFVPVDKGLELAEEAKEIAEETKQEFNNKQNEKYSMFDLLRMLKDPVVQDGIRYASAFLAVMNRRR